MTLAPKPRIKVTALLSAVSAMWLWVAWIHPLRVQLSHAEAARAAAATSGSGTNADERRLHDLREKLFRARRQLEYDREKLWPAGKSESSVVTVGSLSASAGVRVTSVAADNQVRKGDHVRSLRCELRGSFAGLQTFLRLLEEHRPLFHARHLALEALPGEGTPPTLRMTATLDTFELPGEPR